MQSQTAWFISIICLQKILINITNCWLCYHLNNFKLATCVGMHSLYHTYSDYGIFRYKGLLNFLGSIENGLILHIFKKQFKTWWLCVNLRQNDRLCRSSVGSWRRSRDEPPHSVKRQQDREEQRSAWTLWNRIWNTMLQRPWSRSMPLSDSCKSILLVCGSLGIKSWKLSVL